MKVLWFSSSPGNAADCLGDSFVGSSWVSALDKRIQEKVELHLAFYYPKRSDSFKYGKTTYHPLASKNWKFNVLIDIFRKRILDKHDLGRYLDIIKKVKPDIIHIHGTENPFGCIIPYTEVPVIVSIQGYLTVIDHKFQNSFTLRNLKAGNRSYKDLKNIILSKSFLRTKKELNIRKEIEQRNLRETRYLIGRTDWDRRVARILAPRSRYFHCDEILRTVFYEKEWSNTNKTNLLIHSTLNNTPYKGFETICEALIELKGMNGIHLEWQIAGIEQDDLIVKVTRDKLKRRFPTNGIKYLGKVDEHQMAEIMCNADIFVSPSHIENSSNSLCEAMILGLPCIATNVGGTSTLVCDGKDGILIQDGDPWGLAGAIYELHRKPGISSIFSENARKKALLRHNPEKIIKELIEIYKEVLLLHSMHN
mgnify:CR=1 FL=1